MGNYGLLNDQERKTIDAMRRNEFHEIVIRYKDHEKREIIIEEITDQDFHDLKAKELRRILGMKEFSEIVLKYRNDKHIFARSKKRL